MTSVTENKYSDEMHPWNYFIPDGATKLFVGTFPTEERNRRHDFFYSSATNRFWEVITEIAKSLNEITVEPDEIRNRKLVLKKLKLGLTDMGKRVLRQQGSSKDHSLFPLEFMDIFQLLQDHPPINTLIVSGNKQGNCSLSWLSDFCGLNNTKLNTKQLEKNKVSQVNISGRTLHIQLAYSTSRLSGKKTEELIECYRAILVP